LEVKTRPTERQACEPELGGDVRADLRTIAVWGVGGRRSCADLMRQVLEIGAASRTVAGFLRFPVFTQERRSFRERRTPFGA